MTTKMTEDASIKSVETACVTVEDRSASEKHCKRSINKNGFFRAAVSKKEQEGEGGLEVEVKVRHRQNEDDDAQAPPSPSPLDEYKNDADTGNIIVTEICKDELKTTAPSTKMTTTKTKQQRRPSFYADFGPLATNKVLSSLEGYDTDLVNITAAAADNTKDGSHTKIVSVDRHELQRVSLLGKGHFSNVYLVTGSLPDPTTAATAAESSDYQKRDGSSSSNNPSATSMMQRRRKKMQMYAYKSIDPTRVRGADELVAAARDLATEALFLSKLDHDNIIKLRGVCSEPFSKSFVDDAIFETVTDLNGSFQHHSSSSSSQNNSGNGLEGYFLVMDVLTETLSQRLNRWRKNEQNHEQKKTKSSSSGGGGGRRGSLFRHSSTVDNAVMDKKLERMYERVENVGLGIAKGIEYLSSKGIVLRDLKPGNVGFEDCEYSSWNVKLFDFGFARKVEDCDPNEVCGSPRYMAPECMCGDGYTLKVDVYSFGILLFELCSLIVPFSGLNSNDNDGNAAAANKKKKSTGRLRPFSKTSSLWNKIFGGKNRRRKSNSNSNNESNNNTSNTSTSNTAATVTNSDHRTMMTEEFYRQVVGNEIRPTDNVDFPAAVPCPKLRLLIEECWQSDPTKRPSFQDIVPRIQDILLCYKQQQTC